MLKTSTFLPYAQRPGEKCGLDTYAAPCALDEILSGQLPLIQEGSAPLEEEAQRMAERLLEGEADVTGTAGEASSEELQTVAVDSVELTRPRSVGVEQVGRWALEQLGLVELLAELGLNGPLRAAALGAIVGRLARPGSERATWGSGLGDAGQALPPIRKSSKIFF